jgi:hypothetical protein
MHTDHVFIYITTLKYLTFFVISNLGRFSHAAHAISSTTRSGVVQPLLRIRESRVQTPLRKTSIKNEVLRGFTRSLLIGIVLRVRPQEIPSIY